MFVDIAVGVEEGVDGIVGRRRLGLLLGRIKMSHAAAVGVSEKHHGAAVGGIEGHAGLETVGGRFLQAGHTEHQRVGQGHERVLTVNLLHQRKVLGRKMSAALYCVDKLL